MALETFRNIRNINAWFRNLAESGVFDVSGQGAPTNGTSGTGAGTIGPGSTYFDTTAQVLYRQMGTKASPFWVVITPALSGVGSDFATRQRFTTAQVNAGATILPAVSGWKYRVLDMTMIAIGGNATTNTSVRINATQGAGTVQLLDVAIAALTRSTVVRAGAANAVVLADGASFAQCDVNTPILIANNGAGMTVATAIDVIISYQLET